MPHEFKTLDFEIKGVSADGRGSFEGIGAATNNLDRTGDIIAKGAFARDLSSFLSDGFIGGLDHDWKTPIGHPSEAKDVDGGLWFKAVFDETPEAQAMRARMAVHPETGRSTVKKLSIGYKTLESKSLRNEDECKSYWDSVGYKPSATDLDRAKSGARLLTRLQIREVSPVLIPANDRAVIHGVKSLESKDFAEHSRLVASAVREGLEGSEAFLKRFEARIEARVKSGRELSAANFNALKELHDRHGAMCEQHRAVHEKMGAILERTKPKESAKATEEFGPEEKVGAVPVLTLAEIESQYVAVMYATNPAG